MEQKIMKLKQLITGADAVMIGAGAGLSTAAGFVYSGERFDKYFEDFSRKYGFRDMYSGGFYPYKTQEEFWAYFSRNIWVNRYMDAPRPTYDDLFRLVKDKDYFVLTTNVDHCFQKAGRKNLRFSRASLSEGQTGDIQIENLNTSPAGFDKKRLFYTQGDYGLFQCSVPCHKKTYENEDAVAAMVLSQGWEIGPNNGLTVPENVTLSTAVPTELLPTCPVCGKPLTMNLRSDDRFVEDEGWRRAAKRYEDFIRTHDGKVLYLELGVGYNTPGIIKYPFWQLTAQNPDAAYACVNFGEASCPVALKNRSVCLDGDIGDILSKLLPERR